MVDQNLSEEYRCGYCYEQFNFMTDPRELPCHHVFCKRCLEEDFAAYDDVTCRSCLTAYAIENFDELPVAKLSTEVVTSSTSLRCNCHNCDEQVAVCYCVECALKMCDTHEQAHSSIFGDQHKIIQISTYQLHPGIYKKVLCQEHAGEVFEICDKCNCTACMRCNLTEEHCLDAVTDHTFSTLKTLEKEITTHFNNLLESAGEKLTEICKTDKHIWKVLDEEEVECAKRIQMIERVRDEQMEMIREESEKLKEQIYEYQRDLTDQVESYNTELVAKKERLEESCSRVRNWMRESHVTEKVEQRQLMTDELVNNTDVMIDCPFARTPVLLHSGKRQVQETHLASIPTSLTLKSKHDVGSQCLSATYIANGDLLVACEMQVLHLDSLGNTDSIAQDGTVNTVLAYQNSVYMLECIEYERIVYQCLPDIRQKAKLFSYSCQNRKISFAAVSDSYIVAHKPVEGKLVLYDFLTKQTRILTPNTKPWDFHFVQDGDLLVLATNVIPAETLTKYRVDNYQLLTIWTCEDLMNAHRVTSDSDGFIYVATTERTIFIISSDGDKLKEITNDELPKLPGQMSIRGREELVVPTVNEKSAIVFKIDH